MLHEKCVSLITGFTLRPERKQFESWELTVHKDGKIGFKKQKQKLQNPSTEALY